MSTKTIERLPGKISINCRLYRIAYFRNCTSLLITDGGKGLLHICDLDGNLINSLNPKNVLTDPRGIFVFKKDSDEEIYVLDYSAGIIFLFNSKFKLVKKIGSNLKKAEYLSVDSDSDVIFISHTSNDSVSLWNKNSGKFLDKFEIETPLHSRLSKDKLFLVSWADSDYDKKMKKVNSIKKGNFITIFAKASLEKLHEIKFDNVVFPHSIYLSSDTRNIYTIAYQMNDDSVHSKNSFLYTINENYEIKQSIELNDTLFFYDALYLQNKIILCGLGPLKNKLRIIEFERIL